jgi:glutamate-1-semialdehyde 2,1-aminomutase
MSTPNIRERLRTASFTNEQALARIRDVIAGGGSSNMRNQGVPKPLVLREAWGCHIRDVEGHEYIDLNMGYGPHLFGYNDQDVLSCIAGQMHRAHMTGLPSDLDAQAGELVRSLVPSMEQLRFANSGTEAIASALRLARAVTGRQVIVTFECHYHGWSETILRKIGPDLAAREVLPGAPGMISEALLHIRQLPWNDANALEELLQREGHTVAAVICEPVLANDGVCAPAEGFLQRARELTARHGALLIFDEVISGFRVAAGGAQARYDVRPDLTVVSKVMGGGFPVAAFGGSRELMMPLARNEALHAGVYAGNHLAMSAIIAMLEKITTNAAAYEYLEQIGQHIERRLRERTAHRANEILIERVGSVVGFYLVEPAPGSSDASGVRHRPRFAMDAHRELQMLCQERGVYFHPNPREPWFLSTAHTRPILDRAADVIAESIDEATQRAGRRS